MPDSGRRTRPFWISCGTTREMVLMGMAKPTPTLSPVLLAMAVFMPIIRPWLSNSGPPELPGLMAASIWMIDLRLRRPRRPGSERSRLEMMPVLSVRSRPKGLPMANTRWPTSRFVELPGCDGKERVGRGVDLQHGHVGGRIAADEFGGVLLAVEEGDADIAGALDDVEVGQHVAVAVDHRAAPFALRNDLEQQCIARYAPGVDVHHASIDLLVDEHVDPLFRRERVEGSGGDRCCRRCASRGLHAERRLRFRRLLLRHGPGVRKRRDGTTRRRPIRPTKPIGRTARSLCSWQTLFQATW